MKKRTRFKSWLFVGSWLFAGMLVLFVPFTWFLFGDSILERLHRQRFDPVAWQAARNNVRNPVRIRMVDNLLRGHQFRGMTRHQVTSIIGEPDNTDYFRDWDMVYWLGPERGFMGIDSEWLVFRLDHLDQQKRVTDYKIVRD